MALKLLRPLSGRINFLAIAAGAALLVLGFTMAPRLVALISLFDGRHAGIRISQPEAARLHEETARETRPQVVPKIIHQVFHNWRDPGNEKLPNDWDEMRKTCVDLNPGWDIKLWTDVTSREFLAKEYPTFLKTYDGYRYPVQKVDALRYFLMLHYGGIYLDLDNGCNASLEPLLYFPVWLTDGGQGALSNNILGAMPHHPFWEQVTQNLVRYDVNYILPYLIISYASGQWFLTDMWQRYHAALPKRGLPSSSAKVDGGGESVDHRLHQLMMDMRPGSDPWVFFTQGRGGSWDNWDNHFFGWLGNLSQSIPVILVLGMGCAAVVWVLRKKSWRRRRGYRRVQEGLEVSP